jgi:pyruvate-formate lyase-activating enzyme
VGRTPAESLQGEAIVRRARSRLGERRYAIFSNNCEHFCSWCQVGESRSKQVDRLLLRIRAMRCAVCSILPRHCGSYLKRGLRVALSSKSLAAKCLLRFSAAAPTVPTVWESRAISGGGR